MNVNAHLTIVVVPCHVSPFVLVAMLYIYNATQSKCICQGHHAVGVCATSSDNHSQRVSPMQG